MRQRGITLVELLVAVTITGLLLTALLQAFISMHSAHNDVGTFVSLNSDVLDVVDEIGSEVRRAPLCGSCDTTIDGNVQNAALNIAQSSSIRLMKDSAGKWVYYYVTADPNDATKQVLMRQIRSATATPILSADTITPSFQYLLSTGGTHYLYYDPDSSSATWVNSINSYSATIKQVAAVRITMTATRNGYTNTYTTVVRMRNSPAFVRGAD